MTDVPLAEKIGLWLIAVLAVVCAVIFALFMLLPASHWFKVNALHVSQCTVGVPCDLDYAREIRRDFHGAWRVEVNKLNALTQRWVEVCATSWRDNFYSSNTDLPDEIDLSWFTMTPSCWSLNAGVYRLEAWWIINEGHPLAPLLRREQYASDIFEVQNAPLPTDTPP